MAQSRSWKESAEQEVLAEDKTRAVRRFSGLTMRCCDTWLIHTDHQVWIQPLQWQKPQSALWLHFLNVHSTLPINWAVTVPLSFSSEYLTFTLKLQVQTSSCFLSPLWLNSCLSGNLWPIPALMVLLTYGSKQNWVQTRLGLRLGARLWGSVLFPVILIQVL